MTPSFESPAESLQPTSGSLRRAGCDVHAFRTRTCNPSRVSARWSSLGFAFVVALLALPCASGARARSTGDQAQLLAAYQPVLFFHASEDWAPQTVDRYLERVQVERQVAKGTWLRVPPPLLTSYAGCTLSPCLRLDLPCALRSGYTCYHRQALAETDWKAPVLYGSVAAVPASTPAPRGQTQRPSL